LKRPLVVLQAAIQFFVSLGALVSGTMLIVAPSGELLQAPREMLAGSPFNDFLVPGIILVLINGVGQLVAGILTVRRHPLSGFIGFTFGAGLAIWIYVQVTIIGGGHILQHSYLALGIAEMALAFLLQREPQSFRVR